VEPQKIIGTGAIGSAADSTPMTFTLPPVYPITDKRIARRSSHLSILKDLVRGGARFVQIRDKFTPPGALLEDLRRCARFAAENDVTLIVNDRLDLALCCGAAGVHLGQEEMPPPAARGILAHPGIIGFSTHTLTQVRQSRRLPVDYIGFGPVFPTKTKDIAHPAQGLRQLADACRISRVPVVAIGGIELNRVREALQSGATSVAVISALMSARNLAVRMQEFLEEATAK
jgi:thiamine-phosphate pyrophosphorylase